MKCERCVFRAEQESAVPRGHIWFSRAACLSHSLSRSLTMCPPYLGFAFLTLLNYSIARPRHCPRHQSQWVRTTGTCRCYLSTTVRQVATVSHAGTFPLLLTTCTCMVDQRRGKYILQSTHACTPNDLMSLSAAGDDCAFLSRSHSLLPSFSTDRRTDPAS